MQQWDPETGGLTNTLGIDESLSSMAVRDDGRFVAVGTMFTGSVSIYIAFSLQVSFVSCFIFSQVVIISFLTASATCAECPFDVCDWSGIFTAESEWASYIQRFRSCRFVDFSRQ